MTEAGQAHGINSSMREAGHRLTSFVSTSVIHASGSTPFNLQVSMSVAAIAQLAAPISWPANKAFLRLCKSLHNRKNALFAGHDHGAEGWATCASLIETCKLNAVDPLAWMTDTLTKLVSLWPSSRIDELMPWAYVKKPA